MPSFSILSYLVLEGSYNSIVMIPVYLHLVKLSSYQYYILVSHILDISVYNIHSSHPDNVHILSPLFHNNVQLGYAHDIQQVDNVVNIDMVDMDDESIILENSFYDDNHSSHHHNYVLVSCLILLNLFSYVVITLIFSCLIDRTNLDNCQ